MTVPEDMLAGDLPSDLQAIAERWVVS